MVRTLVPLFFLAATGCSAVVAGTPSESDAQSTSVTGVVVVERNLTDDSARGEATARFVRVRGAVDDEALRLVGAALDLPAIGECTAITAGAATRAVELVDVGNVSIESSGQRTNLVGRQLPDVVDLVSGTVYSARIDAHDAVSVLVTGTADVPAFSIRAQAPQAPDAVHVTSLAGGGAEIAWAPASDSIYVEVGNSRCSFADDGRAVLTPSLVADQATIAVHRVRREKLTIPGLAGGELRFDFTRTVSLPRR